MFGPAGARAGLSTSVLDVFVVKGALETGCRHFFGVLVLGL